MYERSGNEVKDDKREVTVGCQPSDCESHQGHAQGMIVACAHVVSASRKGQIETFLHGEPIPYEVIDRGYEDDDDIAILKADLAVLKEKILAGDIVTRTSTIVSGESIMLCGYPYLLGDSNLLPVLTAGIVSTFPMTEEELILVSALLSRGNSGGPCFDGKGRLLGLAKAPMYELGFLQ